MRIAFPLAAVSIAAGLSVFASRYSAHEAQPFAAADLTFRIVDAVTSNGVAGVTIRRAATYEGKCPPVRLVTDEAGVAHYRGPLPKDVAFDIVSPDVHSIRSLRFSQDLAVEGAWKAREIGPVAVRRKKRPHPMMVKSLAALGNDFRETGWWRKLPGFQIDVVGCFSGRLPNGERMALCPLVLEPTDPESGFVLVESFPDELGAPLEAPADGYRSANVYWVISHSAQRNSSPGESVIPHLSFDPDAREASPSGNCAVFRGKTPEGFIYGAVVPTANGLDILINDRPGERSLELEVTK